MPKKKYNKKVTKNTNKNKNKIVINVNSNNKKRTVNKSSNKPSSQPYQQPFIISMPQQTQQPQQPFIINMPQPHLPQVERNNPYINANVMDNEFGLGITRRLNAIHGSVNDLQMQGDTNEQNYLNLMRRNDELHQLILNREHERNIAQIPFDASTNTDVEKLEPFNMPSKVDI